MKPPVLKKINRLRTLTGRTQYSLTREIIVGVAIAVKAAIIIAYFGINDKPVKIDNLPKETNNDGSMELNLPKTKL